MDSTYRYTRADAIRTRATKRRGQRARRGVAFALLAALLALTAHQMTGHAATTPGTGGPAHVVHFGSIIPQVNETGFISLSQDAEGTLNPTGTVTINKPAGATVRAAYASAATTGFSGATLANGDITIDGAGVNFSLSTPNAIGSNNYFGEVTSLVKSKLDGAAAGPVNFTIGEADTGATDGVILSVIFNDPNQTSSNTIVLLFGAQNVSGDDFNIGLANPINKSDPNLKLDMGLGISYSYQLNGTQQYSTVDVNGTRMTTSAGGEDDGADANGALITVGGVGDTNANPADPNATPTNPRSDDELYSLLPFVNTGDTSIKVHTQNPSNDDNIFYSSLTLNSTTAVVGEGIVLAPANATNPINTNHTVTATVQDDNGAPIANRAVTFKVISGPNAGKTGTTNTNAQGKASFTYSSSVAGVDEIQASFLNSAGNKVLSNVARKEWTTGDATPPSCTLSSKTSTGITVTARDTGSGLNSIVVTKSVNATVTVPTFLIGTTNPVVVTANKVNLSLSSEVALRITDVKGNVTNCDPILTTVVRERGARPSAQTFTAVDGTEHIVSITNGVPGLRHIAVTVNGTKYSLTLRAGGQADIDIAKSLQPGNSNTIVLQGRGPGTADVMIWDGNHS